MENGHPLTECPICSKSDQVSRVSEIPEQHELALLLAAPDAPDAPPPLLGTNEGLGCLGALFFGSAFFLSVAFGSLIASIIFGSFILFFAAAFLMVFRRHLAARRRLEAQIAGWQEKMEVWERLLVCHRDRIVFDPQSGKSAPVDQMEQLFD